MRRLLLFVSRISVRLLAFNLLIAFLPIAAFLYLDTYERQLLRALEHALVQQARVLAAALTDRGSLTSAETQAEARRILAALEQRQEARLRVVDLSGRLVADSSRLGPRLPEVAPPDAAVSDAAASDAAAPGDAAADSRASAQSPLYRLASAPVRLYRRLLAPPQAPLESAEYYVNTDVLRGPEVLSALEGRYGSITRISTGGQRSVTLYSAIPVRDVGAVSGAVLASQSTYRILRDLYELRLQIFRIFLVSVAAAAALSLLLATTISAPVARLRREARQLLDRRGRLRGGFSHSRRRDEIGDLARALQQLTDKLQAHLRFVESFAGELAHELRNPLASIRSAAEVLPQTGSEEERTVFLDCMRREVARMERLLSEVGEISRLDAGIEGEERLSVELAPLAAGVLQSVRTRAPGAAVSLSAPQEPLRVCGAPARLAQILENLLDNALDFSPPGPLGPLGPPVEVRLERRGSWAALQVADRGPGIPPGNLPRVFERFFSFRPEGAADTPAARRQHLGLGLSIVKTVAEGYGGRVTATNRPEGGACFEVLLPLDLRH